MYDNAGNRSTADRSGDAHRMGRSKLQGVCPSRADGGRRVVGVDVGLVAASAFMRGVPVPPVVVGELD